MSKDLLLQYANGGGLEPFYYVTYEIRNGEIKIFSVRKIIGGTNDIWFRYDITHEEDKDREEIMQAIEDYKKNNEISWIPREQCIDCDITLNIK